MWGPRLSPVKGEATPEGHELRTLCEVAELGSGKDIRDETAIS